MKWIESLRARFFGKPKIFNTDKITIVTISTLTNKESKMAKQTVNIKGGPVNRHKALAMGKKIPVGKGESDRIVPRKETKKKK